MTIPSGMVATNHWRASTQYAISICRDHDVHSATAGLSQEDNTRVIHSLGWIFPFVAMVMLEISYRCVIRTAKKQNSPALAAMPFTIELMA